MGLFDFLYDDPSKDAQKYLNRIPGTVKPYYDPYIQAGQRQLPGLEQQYGQLMNDPGGRMNEIGSSFQQSPGFQFALQQALQGSGQAAAAGGMAGSPQHEQQNMGIATQLGNQDYYNYLGNALNMYTQGLQGSQGLYNSGQNASNSLADLLASGLGSQASLGYAGGANQNMMGLGTLGLLGGGLSSLYKTNPFGIFGNDNNYNRWPEP